MNTGTSGCASRSRLRTLGSVLCYKEREKKLLNHYPGEINKLHDELHSYFTRQSLVFHNLKSNLSYLC